MLKLAFEAGFVPVVGKDVLHFAAEPIITHLCDEAGPRTYRRADLEPTAGDIVLNIEAIDLPTESVDTILCSHVLEHVDDRRALGELFRILRPRGVLAVMIPLIEGWPATYEPADIRSPGDRFLHFGQHDHVRYYGADFRDHMRGVGFLLDEFTAEGPTAVRHGLTRGEKVFRGTKPA